MATRQVSHSNPAYQSAVALETSEGGRTDLDATRLGDDLGSRHLAIRTPEKRETSGGANRGFFREQGRPDVS